MSDRTIIRTDDAPPPGGHYSTAVVANGFVYTAGQTGVNPGTGKLAVGLEAQIRQALTNFIAVLEAGGSRSDLLVKTLCFVDATDYFDTFNRIYAEFFPSDPPARSTVGVTFPGDLMFEIEGVALLAE